LFLTRNKSLALLYKLSCRMMSWRKLMERRLSRWMEREKELKMEVIMNRRTPWEGSAVVVPQSSVAS
jgi:hypothetical protein